MEVQIMTVEKVLKNLENLIGTEFDADEIICAFEDFEEEGETEVIVKESENYGYDALAYINSEKSTQFLFKISNGIINDVCLWHNTF
jgi:hypothetical protein